MDVLSDEIDECFSDGPTLQKTYKMLNKTEQFETTDTIIKYMYILIKRQLPSKTIRFQWNIKRNKVVLQKVNELTQSCSIIYSASESDFKMHDYIN